MNDVRNAGDSISDERLHSARRDLLLAIEQVCPSSAVQFGFTAMVHQMVEAGESERAIFVALLHALGTGMQYNNWPGAGAPVQQHHNKDGWPKVGYVVADFTKKSAYLQDVRGRIVGQWFNIDNRRVARTFFSGLGYKHFSDWVLSPPEGHACRVEMDEK